MIIKLNRSDTVFDFFSEKGNIILRNTDNKMPIAWKNIINKKINSYEILSISFLSQIEFSFLFLRTSKTAFQVYFSEIQIGSKLLSDYDQKEIIKIAKKIHEKKYRIYNYTYNLI